MCWGDTLEFRFFCFDTKVTNDWLVPLLVSRSETNMASGGADEVVSEQESLDAAMEAVLDALFERLKGMSEGERTTLFELRGNHNDSKTGLLRERGVTGMADK